MASFDVAGPDAGGEAELAVVCDRDGLVRIVEDQGREDRPEDLLARDTHLVVDAGEDRRLDEETAGALVAIRTLSAE